MALSTSEHLVSSYEEELTRLAESIAEMGGLVEAALSNATLALLKLDGELAQATILADKQIDMMQRRIDETADALDLAERT